MGKLLKDVPAPNKETLAMFSGHKGENIGRSKKTDEERLSVFYGGKDKTATIATETTVAPKTTVVKKQKRKEGFFVINNTIPDILVSTLTPHQQTVYLKLYRLSYGFNKNTTGWIGYRTLAKGCNICLKTSQRAINFLIKKGYIKRVDYSNIAQIKGSKYQVFLPQEIKGLTTVVNKTTVAPKTTVPWSQRLQYRSHKDHHNNTYSNNTNNNKDVVVNFFNQRFKNHQNSLNLQTVNLLLKNHNKDKILLYINRISTDDSIRNPAGFLCKALNNNWDLIPTKKELIEKQKLYTKKELKKQEEKNETEKRKFEQIKIKEEQLNKIFSRLSNKEQNKLKKKAIKILKLEHPNISSQTFNTVIATETMIMIKVRELLKKRPMVSRIEKDVAKEIENSFGIPVKFGAEKTQK